MTAVAAIGPAARADRPAHHAVTLGVYVAGVALVLTSAAILAGFVNVRAATKVWPPDGVVFDEYLSVMLSATMALAVAFAGWASWAARTGNDRQALGGLALSGGMGLAFVNLAWYTGAHAGFGPSAHAYGLLFLASVAVVTIAAASAVVFAAVALVRTLGRAPLPGHELITAAARYWFLVGVAWAVSPVAFYGLTSVK